MASGESVQSLPQLPHQMLPALSFDPHPRSFWTNGQICSATSRLLLHESIAPKFLEHLKKRAESIKIDDPLQAGVRLGPLVSSLLREPAPSPPTSPPSGC